MVHVLHCNGATDNTIADISFTFDFGHLFFLLHFSKCDKYTRRNVQAQLRSICHWFIEFPHTHHQIHFPFLCSSAHSICSWIVVRSNYMRYLILLLNNIKVICVCVSARSLTLCVYWLNGDLALRSTKWPHYRDLTCSYQSNEWNAPLFSRLLWPTGTGGDEGRASDARQSQHTKTMAWMPENE